MEIFNLPPSAEYGRVIPKNSFDAFTNSRQKQLFIDFILRITWKYKISTTTVNLGFKNIEELQVIEIELKKKSQIKEILDVFDREISSHIVFVVRFGGESYLSTSSKHVHATDIDKSVIDHTFHSDWVVDADVPFFIPLKVSIDHSYKQLCIQLCDRPISPDISLSDLLEQEIAIKHAKNEIKQLQSKISKCKQFNQKVELNGKLRKLEERLFELLMP